MGLTDAGQLHGLDELRDAGEAGAQVSGQRFKFFVHRIVAFRQPMAPPCCTRYGIDCRAKASSSACADGTVWRVDASGNVQLVASGFHNPVGLHFVGDALWVTDINGDCMLADVSFPRGA